MMTMNEPERIDKLIQDTDAVIVALKDIDSKKYNEFKDRFDAAIETPEDGILTEEEQFNKIRRLLIDIMADVKMDKARNMDIAIGIEIKGLLNRLSEIDEIEDLKNFELELNSLIEEYENRRNRTEGLTLKNKRMIEIEIAKRIYYFVKVEFSNGEGIKEEELKRMIPERYKVHVYSYFEEQIDKYNDIGARKMLHSMVAPSPADMDDEAKRIYDVRLWQGLVLAERKELYGTTLEVREPTNRKSEGEKIASLHNEEIKELRMLPEITIEGTAKSLRDKEMLQIYNSGVKKMNEENKKIKGKIEEAKKKFEESGFSNNLEQLNKGEVYICKANKDIVSVIDWQEDGQISIKEYWNEKGIFVEGNIMKAKDFEKEMLRESHVTLGNLKTTDIDLQKGIEQANIINRIGSVLTTEFNDRGPAIFEIKRGTMALITNKFENQETEVKCALITGLNDLFKEKICRKIGRVDDKTFKLKAIWGENPKDIWKKMMKYADKLKREFPNAEEYLNDVFYRQFMVVENYRILPLYIAKQAEYSALKQEIIDAENERAKFEVKCTDVLNILENARGKIEGTVIELNLDKPNLPDANSNRRQQSGPDLG